MADDPSNEDDNKAATTKGSTKRRRPSLSEVKASKKKSKLSDKELDAKMQKARLVVKAEFEARRDEIVSNFPQRLKDMFGEIGFTKWSGKVYGCLVLNPFNVPPGEVRHTFYAAYDKVGIQTKERLCVLHGLFLMDRIAPYCIAEDAGSVG